MWKKIKSFIDYRELIVQLALKDLKVRYKRPFLGQLWAFLTPLFTVIILQVIFSVILRVAIQEYPFFIYLMTAVFPWRFFQVSVSRSTTAILDNKNLVQECSFPRELIPISVVAAEVVNFIPSLMIIFVFLFCFKIAFSPLVFLLPGVLLLHTALIIGICLIISGLQVRYRDIQYIVEIALMALFYLTPVFYSLNILTSLAQGLFLRLYLLNPLVGILNLYRISLLKGFAQTLPAEVTIFNTLGVPLLWALFLLFFGFYVFKRSKQTFSDYLLI